MNRARRSALPVEFDTYQNTFYGDPAGSHIAIQSNGIAPNSADHTSSANLAGPVLANFADGNPHTATVTYDGTNLSVYLDGGNTPLLAVAVNLNTIFTGGAGPNAFVGFTAATGEAQENSVVASWSWNQ